MRVPAMHGPRRIKRRFTRAGRARTGGRPFKRRRPEPVGFDRFWALVIDALQRRADGSTHKSPEAGAHADAHTPAVMAAVRTIRSRRPGDRPRPRPRAVVERAVDRLAARGR